MHAGMQVGVSVNCALCQVKYKSWFLFQLRFENCKLPRVIVTCLASNVAPRSLCILINTIYTGKELL